MWPFDFLRSFSLIVFSPLKVRSSPSSGRLTSTSTSLHSLQKNQKVSCQHNTFFQNGVGRRAENVTLIHTYTNWISMIHRNICSLSGLLKAFFIFTGVFSLALCIFVLALLSSEMTRIKENMQKSNAEKWFRSTSLLAFGEEREWLNSAEEINSHIQCIHSRRIHKTDTEKHIMEAPESHF